MPSQSIREMCRMRITESLLRTIIKEEILKEASSDDFWDDDDLYFDEPDDDDEGGIFISSNLDDPKRDIRYEEDPSSPEAKQITNARRNLKRLWNKRADMSFFQDPKKLVPVHYMGLYSGKGVLADYFPEAVAAAEQGREIPRTPGIHITNRNELSCIGYIQPFRIDSLRGGSTFLTFSKYRVTFAANHDAYTERLSQAGPQHRAFYAGSGYPKRPGLGLGAHNMLLNAKSATNPIPEVVIDNWIVDTYCGPASDEKMARKIGLNFIHNGQM